MSNTKFIEQIDSLLKQHYGANFAWGRLEAYNFKRGTGKVVIDTKRQMHHVVEKAKI